MYWVFCFFKQKTAYEMRISDWSSDVCPSDLVGRRRAAHRDPPSLRPGALPPAAVHLRARRRERTPRCAADAAAVLRVSGRGIAALRPFDDVPARREPAGRRLADAGVAARRPAAPPVRPQAAPPTTPPR